MTTTTMDRLATRCGAVILALLQTTFLVLAVGINSAHAEDSCTNPLPYKQLAYRALKKYNHLKKLFSEERKFINYRNDAPGTDGYEKWSDPDMAFDIAHDDFGKSTQNQLLPHNCNPINITEAVLKYSDAIYLIITAEALLTHAHDTLVTTYQDNYESRVADANSAIADANSAIADATKILQSEVKR